jgi:hypothetical protein
MAFEKGYREPSSSSRTGESRLGPVRLQGNFSPASIVPSLVFLVQRLLLVLAIIAAPNTVIIQQNLKMKSAGGGETKLRISALPK